MGNIVLSTRFTNFFGAKLLINLLQSIAQLIIWLSCPSQKIPSPVSKLQPIPCKTRSTYPHSDGSQSKLWWGQANLITSPPKKLHVLSQSAQILHRDITRITDSGWHLLHVVSFSTRAIFLQLLLQVIIYSEVWKFSNIGMTM